MRVRPHYTPQFRSDAVQALIRTDRSFAEVAHDLGVSEWSLRAWYKRDQMAKKSKKTKSVLPGSPIPPTATQNPEERLAHLEQENAALRKEVDSLRMDREILKKAAAFFAKESE